MALQHDDIFRTGEKAGWLLLRAARQEIKPVMAATKINMMQVSGAGRKAEGGRCPFRALLLPFRQRLRPLLAVRQSALRCATILGPDSVPVGAAGAMLLRAKEMVRHALCPVSPPPSERRHCLCLVYFHCLRGEDAALPLPRVATAFMAKALPLPGVCCHCLRG